MYLLNVSYIVSKFLYNGNFLNNNNAYIIAQSYLVAHKVMENSPHSLLVWDGPVAFAQELGFTFEPNENMLSDYSAIAYLVFTHNCFHHYLNP